MYLSKYFSFLPNFFISIVIFPSEFFSLLSNHILLTQIILTVLFFKLLLPEIYILIMFYPLRTMILFCRFPPHNPFTDLHTSIYIPSRFDFYMLSSPSSSLNVFSSLQNILHHSVPRFTIHVIFSLNISLNVFYFSSQCYSS